MNTVYSIPTELALTSNQQEVLAQQSSKALASLLRGTPTVHLTVQSENEEAIDISIPDAAARLLLQALEEMAQGREVALLPTDAELTTQEAADLIRVSRPFLIKLLEEGKIPYGMVGAHRRVLYRDVTRYIEQEEARRVKVMEELVAETERLGLYE